jgi:hypothetical protein
MSDMRTSLPPAWIRRCVARIGAGVGRTSRGAGVEFHSWGVIFVPIFSTVCQLTFIGPTHLHGWSLKIKANLAVSSCVGI